ncbi:flagellar protein [Gorillibacterium sp. CAU 1737]|uniref:flagellar protein n=1 Tax=Gorillibacterium sp. CAU 1737 TaxID=3140362 RepID=UPI00326164C2
MTLNVMNCTRCGKLCVRTPSEMCGACLKDLELQYEDCLHYLRENRGITLQELSDATGVPVKQIIRFIREGRISLVNAPNLSYPCEVCGTLIREQAMCPSCRQRLMNDFAQAQEDERKKDGSKQPEGVSYQIKDRLRERNK